MALRQPLQVLLVEGPDDMHVFWNLFERHSIAQTFEVKPKGGVSKLIEELDVELLASDLAILGIVVDADANIAGRWQSLRAKLQGAGYSSVPESPGEGGTVVVQEHLPRVGIWIMPDNRLGGAIEDFIAHLVPPGDALWPYAVACVQAIEPPERRFAHRVAKANIHTWLAWQESPGTPMGAAIKQRYLESNSPEAQAFLAWIRRLFEHGPIEGGEQVSAE